MYQFFFASALENDETELKECIKNGSKARGENEEHKNQETHPSATNMPKYNEEEEPPLSDYEFEYENVYSSHDYTFDYGYDSQSTLRSNDGNLSETRRVENSIDAIKASVATSSNILDRNHEKINLTSATVQPVQNEGAPEESNVQNNDPTQAVTGPGISSLKSKTLNNMDQPNDRAKTSDHHLDIPTIKKLSRCHGNFLFLLLFFCHFQNIKQWSPNL